MSAFRYLVFSFLVLLLWSSVVAGWILWVGYHDKSQPADVIIVLGAAAYDSRPSPVFAERIRHGIDLYQRKLAPMLLFTGGYGGTNARFAESQVAKRFALRQGVAEQAILIETRSHSTLQNLEQAANLMRVHNMHTAIIVSDPLHMARALRLCKMLGITAFASATPSSRFRSWHSSWQFLLHEIYFFTVSLFISERSLQ